MSKAAKMYTLTINEAGSEEFMTEEFFTIEEATVAYDAAVARYRAEQATWPSHIQVLNFISVDGELDGEYQYDILYCDGAKIRVQVAA